VSLEYYVSWSSTTQVQYLLWNSIPQIKYTSILARAPQRVNNNFNFKFKKIYMKSIANILSALGLAVMLDLRALGLAAEPNPITLDLKAMPDPIALGLAAQPDPMALCLATDLVEILKDRKQIKGSQILNLSKSHKCHFFPLSFTCLLNVHALLVRCLKMHGNECYYCNLMKIIIMYL